MSGLDLEALRAAVLLDEAGKGQRLGERLAPAGPTRVVVWLRHFG